MYIGKNSAGAGRPDDGRTAGSNLCVLEYTQYSSTAVSLPGYLSTKFSTAVPVPGYPDTSTAVPRNVVLNLVRVRDELVRSTLAPNSETKTGNVILQL